MGGSKKTTETTPWRPAQPYILDNLKDTKETFDTNQPGLQQAALNQQATYGRLAPGAEAGIVGAQGLVNRTIAGDMLNGNPFLEGIIGKTRSGITNQVNSQFTDAGRYGSGAHAGVLAGQLADAENSLRFQNYGMERGYQQQAIGDAQNLMGGAIGLANNAAQLPWIGVSAQNGGTVALSSPYRTETTRTNPGVLGTINGAVNTIGNVAGTAGMFLSDERKKKLLGIAGTEPATGVPLYNFEYKGDPGNPQVGPLAQDVERVKPEAVATMPNGTKAVDYGQLAVAPPTSPVAPIDVPQINRPKQGFFTAIKEDPTFSRPENANRLFWARVAAASGSPFGQAVVGGRSEDMDRQAQEERIAIAQQSANALEQYREAMATRAAEPPPPTAGMRAWQEWSSLPPAQREQARPFFQGAGLDPNVQRPLIDMKAQEAEELARLRAGLRPPSRPSTAPPKYRAAGGQVLKWVP